MNSLKIKNLTKKYANGVQAMNDISLEIENGMFGKKTLETMPNLQQRVDHFARAGREAQA